MSSRASISRPAAPSVRNARFSLPKEHGAYLTLAGATLSACVVAPHLQPAVGVGLALAAGFFARGPIDRSAAHVPLRSMDGALLVLLAVLAAVGSVLAGTAQRWMSAVAGVAALALPLGSALVRRVRLQRDVAFELAVMAALGASAGLAALAGGAAGLTAASLAIVLGMHALVSVPIVRTELHRAERAAAGRALASSALAIVGATLALGALGEPIAALALGPRALQVARRLALRPPPRRPVVVGLWETATLAAAVAVAAATLAA